MSFLNVSFFKGKKRNKMQDLISETCENLFHVYGVASPSESQRLRMSLYICLAGVGVLNALCDERVVPVINELVENTKELTKNLSMKVRELALDTAELKAIIAEFPISAGVNVDTKINGLAGFDALYHAKVESVVNDILRHKDGPFGVQGYAGIVVSNGVLGHTNTQDYFMDASMCIIDFMGKLPDTLNS